MCQHTQVIQVRNDIFPQLLKYFDQTHQSNDTQCQIKTSTKKKRDALIKWKKPAQLLSYFHLMHPRPFHHVYKLFNTFGINQTALENPDFQQSYFRTIFYHNFISKVQKYKNGVVMSISPLEQQLTQPSTQYLINRLKSQGNKACYQIACQIEAILATMMSVKAQNKPIAYEAENQSITKCLNQFAGQMFMYKFKSQQIAISNELLKFMGYDVQEFAVQATKYRNVFVDFLSSNSYSQILAQAGKVIRLFLTADMSKITPEEFINYTRLEFTDYIYSKDYKKSFCQLQYFVTPKRAICIRVKKVLNEVDQLSWRPLGGSKKGYENQKKNWLHKENRIYNKLGVIPSNCLEEDTEKMAIYKTVQQNVVKSEYQTIT